MSSEALDGCAGAKTGAMSPRRRNAAEEVARPREDSVRGALWVALGGISALWAPRAVLRGAPA